MTNEKIQLPDFLIADLYKGSLVDLDTFKAKKAPEITEEQPVVDQETIASSEEIKILGENKKHVTIVVNQPSAVFVAEDELTFLTNILKACQLNLADIAIINLATQSLTWEAIKNQLEPVNMLLFEVEPSIIKLPFMIPQFQLQKFDNCTIMVAPSLSLLNNPAADGKLLKTKLWMSLK